MRRRTLYILGMAAMATLADGAGSVTWAAISDAVAPDFSCARYFEPVERQESLPTGVLAAIATVESGRDDRRAGWPWTVDAGGAGARYSSKQEAVAAVRGLQAQGRRNIDVGCMQINLMHHPLAFASLEQAFDPAANVAYAGHFLKTLWQATGSWDQAIARYHSGDPSQGEPYRQRVSLAWSGGDSSAPLFVEAFQRLAVGIPAKRRGMEQVRTRWGNVRIYRPGTEGATAAGKAIQPKVIQIAYQKRR